MSFWGKACKAASIVPAIYAGAAKGAYDAATGKGSFNDGYDKVGGKLVDAAEDFGEKHKEQLTNATIKLGSTIAGNEYKKHRGT
jgi:hypothetical protein